MNDNQPRLLRPSTVIGALATGLAVLAVYLLRLDDAAGLIVDDAWYIVLAKALARGDGYRLISAATTPFLPAVPPGFPLILAAGFRLNPQFPDNLIWLKAISVASMLGVGLLSHRYFRLVRRVPSGEATGLSLATVLTPALVFLATSTVMAECVFAMTQLTGAWFVDRATRADTASGQQRLSSVAGLVAGISLLVRSAGIALIVSAIVLLLTRRRWHAAILFACAVAACQAPWMVYSRLNAPTAAQQQEHGGSMAYSYSDLLSFRVGGSAPSGRATLSDVAIRVRDNLSSMAAKDLGAIVIPSVYRGPGESGQEVLSLGASRILMPGSMGNTAGTLAISSVLAFMTVLGFRAMARIEITTAELLVPASVAMIALVPSWSIRYLLTLAPFLFLYLMSGIELTTRWVTRTARSAAPDLPKRVARIALVSIIGLQALEHVQYIALARDRSAIDWLGDADEADEVFAFLNDRLPPDALVASTNPGLVYLRTGRKSIASDDPSGNWRRWRAMGVRYLVALRVADLPPKFLGYDVRFRTRRHNFWVIEISDQDSELTRGQLHLPEAGERKGAFGRSVTFEKAKQRHRARVPSGDTLF
jgi:hypothetical protein